VKALLFLPIILPFATAAATLIFRYRVTWQQNVSLLGTVLHFGLCIQLLADISRNGMITLQVADWPAPFGITLAADHLSAILVAAAGCLSLAAMAYARAEIDEDLLFAGFHPLRFQYPPLTGIPVLLARSF